MSPLNFLFCIGVQLINNAVIISGGEQKDSAILSQAPPHPGCHITLRRVPCAIQ